MAVFADFTFQRGVGGSENSTSRLGGRRGIWNLWPAERRLGVPLKVVGLFGKARSGRSVLLRDAGGLGKAEWSCQIGGLGGYGRKTQFEIIASNRLRTHKSGKVMGVVAGICGRNNSFPHKNGAIESESELHAMIRLIDAWLDTMRGPEGYGGPAVHWWQDCLDFSGPGMDWRYEGIISGYLNLYKDSGNPFWVHKAKRAGDDLVRAQLPSGNYPRSSFEANPYPGGTPHEAACDLALLLLAAELIRQRDISWMDYYQTAERNLGGYIIKVLWDDLNRYFWNSPRDPTFVPNKAATIVSAILAGTHLAGNSDRYDRLIVLTLDKIVSCQISMRGHRLEGAIDQAWGAKGGSGRYFPLYIARCIPALIGGYEHTGERRYLRAAQGAMGFLLRARLSDGSFPQVIYANGRINRYPQWIAAAGDILGAMDIMTRQGMEIEVDATLAWLLAGFLPTGGIRTARGFNSILSQLSPGIPEFRDLLPVCGWVDKAFRYLTSRVSRAFPMIPVEPTAFECDCVFWGRSMRYREDGRVIECWEGDNLRYQWRKGTVWAEVNYL